jgi:hypothetical protein
MLFVIRDSSALNGHAHVAYVSPYSFKSHIAARCEDIVLNLARQSLRSEHFAVVSIIFYGNCSSVANRNCLFTLDMPVNGLADERTNI